MKLEIIFEDKDIIVCYKPAGLPTQTKQFGKQDMESLLKNYRASKKEEPYIGIVHRLDQPVEGVMVFAKNQKAAADLSKQVRERTIGKKYYAAVDKQTVENLIKEGLEPSGTLTDYIATDQRKNLSEVVPQAQAKQKQAKKAVLDYNLLPGAEDRDYRVLDITLHTGRHHQIRLQLSHAGCPIIGDQKYGVGERGQKLLLCSYEIAFLHPTTKKEMIYSIQPKNMEL